MNDIDKIIIEINEDRDGSLSLSCGDDDMETDLVFAMGAMRGDPLLDRQREILEWIVSKVNNDKIVKVALEMFEADHKYGCGFYAYQTWRLAYAKLQKLVGYRDTTSVLNEYDNFEDLINPNK
jgi:hypothetical protein